MSCRHDILYLQYPVYWGKSDTTAFSATPPWEYKLTFSRWYLPFRSENSWQWTVLFSWIGKKVVWCTWRRGDRRRRGLLGESALLPLSHCSQCKHFLIVDHEDFPSSQSCCLKLMTYLYDHTWHALPNPKYDYFLSAFLSTKWNIFHRPLPAMSVYDVSFEAAEWNVAMQLIHTIQALILTLCRTNML